MVQQHQHQRGHSRTHRLAPTTNSSGRSVSRLSRNHKISAPSVGGDEIGVAAVTAAVAPLVHVGDAAVASVLLLAPATVALLQAQAQSLLR